MADPQHLDPDLVARWIGIAAQLASARDLQRRGGGPWPGLALVAADTANETTLGTIATTGPQPPGPQAHFDEIYRLAFEILSVKPVTISPTLQPRILGTHRQRNLAVHLAQDPSPRAVEQAIETAEELRGVAVEALGLSDALRGSPIAAAAALIAIGPISEPLAAAETLVAEESFEAAANKASLAFAAAIERLRPELESNRHLSMVRPADRVSQLEVIVAQQALLHEDWILALGLGLRPAELARLRRVLGTPYQMGSNESWKFERESNVVFDRHTVTWAVRLTADVIYRMWQGESLATGDWPYIEPERGVLPEAHRPSA